MSTRHLALVPRDGYFFKDGRGWSDAGTGGGERAAALEWPYPTTVRGALRTAYGLERIEREQAPFTPDDWRRHTAGLRIQALLALRRPFGLGGWDPTHRIWAAPADALTLEREPHIEALLPRPLPTALGTLGRDDDPAREALWKPWRSRPEIKPDAAPARWWTEDHFARWLAQEPVAREPHPPSLPQRLEIHLAVQPDTQTAEDSMLFSTPRTETLAGWPAHEWGLGVRAEIPEEWSAREVPLGADRRPAWSNDVTDSLFAPPPRLARSWTHPSRGLRLIVVTPGEFDGWRLPGFVAKDRQYRGRLPGLPGEFVLRAAFVPRSTSVSGWDMAAANGRGAPKPVRRLVSAGAVYFLSPAADDGVSWNDARSLWLAQLGAGSDDGLGCVVPGRWNPDSGS
jgi:CRISPR-associated protein Cmr3